MGWEWDDESSVEERAELEAAEQVRLSQSDQESSDSSGRSVSHGAVWWARRLRDVCREQRLAPGQNLPKQWVVSGCSGCCAEAEVLKETCL